MSSRSFSVGNYIRHVEEPENEFDTRVRAFRDGSVDELLPQKFENWSAEQVKEAVEGIQRSDKAAQDRLATQQNGNAFVAGNKAYIDSEANAQLMLHEMDVMFGEGYHALEHFEAAYESLRKTTFLKLNQAEVIRQQQAADKQRYEAERARSAGPTEQELYDMPLEDLRILDAVENQRRTGRR